MEHRATRWSVACFLLETPGGAIAALHAHEHGAASLRVAVDGGLPTMTSSNPLENLLGFEHAPRTPARRTLAW